MDWLRLVILFAIGGGLLLLLEWFRRNVLDKTLDQVL